MSAPLGIMARGADLRRIALYNVFMVAIRGHFDGRVLVPEEPVDLPANESLLIRIERIGASPRRRLTARELLNSGLIGLWRDRTDVDDSAAWARQLRERAEHRRGPE